MLETLSAHGYWVSQLLGCDIGWITIAQWNQNGALGEQSFCLTEEFPSGEIEHAGEEGKTILTMCLADLWVVLFYESSEWSPAQSWRIETDFPAAFIKEAWDAGKSVTNIALHAEDGARRWTVVCSDDPCPQKYQWTATPANVIEAAKQEGYS